MKYIHVLCTMKKEITFTIGKTKETIELFYDTKFIQPVQKIMKDTTLPAIGVVTISVSAV